MSIAPLDPDELLQRDLPWLQRRRKQLSRFKGPDSKRAALLAAYESRLAESTSQRQARAEQIPEVKAAPALPISEREDELIEAIQKHQVI
ncbi:MAG: hypothetical protein AAGJ52_01260, partial [Pseudomonadota bacterium]